MCLRTILIGSGTAGWVSSWTSSPHNLEAVQLDQGCCHVFSSASMEMNTDLDPVGTAIPGEIAGEIAALA